MTFEQMLSKKKEKGYSCRMLSELSGVPLSTVQKIFSGVTKNPRHETIDALEAVLWDAAYAADHPETTSIPSGGDHTVEEWYELPEDILCELIDGVFYELGTPSISHQRILGELFVQFRNCILDHASDCEVLFAPTGVRLDRDNRTMVIPDLLVFCGHEFLNDRYFDGAPDLVVEILSPSTRKKDMTIKMSKYRNAGVKEYWIVDIPARQIMVYDLTSYEFPHIYSFEEKIPVQISKGTCAINISNVIPKLNIP